MSIAQHIKAFTLWEFVKAHVLTVATVRGRLMRLGWKIFLPLSLVFLFLISGWLMVQRVGLPI